MGRAWQKTHCVLGSTSAIDLVIALGRAAQHRDFPPYIMLGQRDDHKCVVQDTAAWSRAAADRGRVWGYIDSRRLKIHEQPGITIRVDVGGRR